MSKPRREYDVYLESYLSLGIACGKLVVPPNAEVFKVREVLEEDTEAADEIKRLRELLEKALTYSHSMPTTLVAVIEKEMSDE